MAMSRHILARCCLLAQRRLLAGDPAVAVPTSEAFGDRFIGRLGAAGIASRMYNILPAATSTPTSLREFSSTSGQIGSKSNTVRSSPDT